MSLEDMAEGLEALIETIHWQTKEAGWWDLLYDNNPASGEEAINALAAKIALIHSEASKMLEGLRKGEMDKHLPTRTAEEVEAADLIIRILDYCGYRGFDVVGALFEKLAYNQTRSDHKRSHRQKPGGKKI